MAYWNIHLWGGLALALVLLSAGAQPARAAKFIPTSPFTGAALPEPPHQHDPWTPPTAVPPALASATTTLFAQGLADPRGGEYRQIAVGVGSVWSGDGGVAQTHGWALPAAPGETPRFAVCWNGLVYPVVRVGDPADLAADVGALVKADQDARTAEAKSNPNFPFTRFGDQAPPEATSISETSFLPLKVCLLLRSGRADLARAFWDEWTAGTPPHVNGDDVSLADPYLRLASDWAWALFDRAVTAHMRGDDRLAVLDCRELSRVQPLIEAEAERRDFPKPHYFDSARQNQFQPYLNFLDPLPALLADEQRRVLEAKRVPALTAGLETFPTKAARVAALIQDLDLVSVRQWGQPGGVSLGSDPIVVALIEQGDEAVPPLLDTLVHDDRLTRSVHFGRSFFRNRSVLSVPEAAYVALSGILETSFFGVGSTGDDLTQHPAAERRQIAADIRSYWLKCRGLSLPERWYKTLADDTARPEQWLQAAGGIIQPDNVQYVPGSMIFSESVTTPLAPGRPPRFRGEVLRAEAAPSVSELMAKRVSQMAPGAGPPTSSIDFNRMRDATRMTLIMSAWDARAAVPALRAQMQRCEALFQTTPYYRSFVGDFAPDYAQITLARRRGGDTTALPDYDAWLRGLQADTLPSFSRDQIAMFAPLWLYPDDLTARATADWVFDDPRSPWNPLLQKRPTSVQVEGLISSPLLGLSAFRRQVLLALADDRRVGTITVRPGDPVDVRLDRVLDYGGMTGAPGVATPLRACDVYASSLAQVNGFAAYDPAWPPARRDQSIQQDARLLRRYGERLAYDSAFAGLTRDFPQPLAHLTFPALAHPATDADVQAGRAIFALPGVRRVLKMPPFPLKACWLTLKDDPYPQQFDAATGKPREVLAYHQDGWVWQAEERRVNGHWERFYGFVGPHEIAQAPASEIEFPVNTAADPTGYSWLSLPQGLDARLTGPTVPTGASLFATGLSLNTVKGTTPEPRLGDPLPLTLQLRNRSGLAQRLPTLRAGITLHLLYAAPDPSNPQDGPYGTHDWQELPMKAGTSFTPSAAAKVLEPTEAAAVMTLDLNTWFAVTRPGFYRAELALDAASGLPPGKINTWPFQLLPADRGR